jgi:hypothetical protein
MQTQTLQLSGQKAREIYKTAPDALKAILSETFGATYFSEKITDRVKTFEDALELVGCSDNMKTLLAYNGIDKEMWAALSFAKLSIIRKALNEGWEPDYSKTSEYKYYPWLKYNAGSGFSLHAVGCDRTDAVVGARLSFKTEALARYAAEQFAGLYNDLFTL